MYEVDLEFPEGWRALIKKSLRWGGMDILWNYLILTKFCEYLIFAKSQAPYFASIKFRDFERKLELECIKFHDLLFRGM